MSRVKSSHQQTLSVPSPQNKSTLTLLIAVRAGSQAASRSCTNSWMLLEITLEKNKINQAQVLEQYSYSIRTVLFDMEGRKSTRSIVLWGLNTRLKLYWKEPWKICTLFIREPHKVLQHRGDIFTVNLFVLTHKRSWRSKMSDWATPLHQKEEKPPEYWLGPGGNSA